MNTTLNLREDFEVHPRKRVPPTPTHDWAGRRMPYELHEIYKSYSDAKANAHKRCYNLMRKYNGCNFAITGHNCMQFTVSFDFPNPDTGEPMRAIITRDHTRCYFIG